MRKIYVLLILSVYPFFLSFSQKAKISGVVTDFKTKETLVGVNVIINDKKVIATDDKGFYSTELDPGRYTFEYRLVGYTSKKRIEKFKENEVVTLNMRLEEEAKVLEALLQVLILHSLHLLE